MTATDTADHCRWLAPDPGASWEHTRVVAVHRHVSETRLVLRFDHSADFLAGQYYLVLVATESAPRAVQQAYSLSSSPFPPTSEVEITVREIAGGRVSPLLARQVQEDDILQVRGPFGFLTKSDDDDGPVGLIGAGSGVAPLISIVRHAAARGMDIPMTMLCSSRGRETVLLRQPLQELRDEHRWFELVHTFTRSPGAPDARYHRRIDAAMIAEVMERGDDPLAARTFYVAGPADMVGAVRADLGDLGVPEAGINSEDHA